MDPDAFPNSLEYWGPTGLVWFRNVQLRWTPVQGDGNLTLALERPARAAIRASTPTALSCRTSRHDFRCRTSRAPTNTSQKWGYVRAAGLLRLIKWDDNLDDAFDLSGDATGWGINLSSNLKPTETMSMGESFM